MQYLTKEDLSKKCMTWKLRENVGNKFNRKKESFHLSKDILGAFVENIFEETPVRFHDHSFDTPTINETGSQSLSNSSGRKFRSCSISDFNKLTQQQNVNVFSVEKLYSSMQKLLI